jgi:hypothetical protein
MFSKPGPMLSRTTLATTALLMAIGQGAHARHKETVCPPPSLADSAEDALLPGLTGTPLMVGATEPTNGVGIKTAPELTNVKAASWKKRFVYKLPGGSAATGYVTQLVKYGNDKFCKCEFVIEVDKYSEPDVCVSDIRIYGFWDHGRLVVADYRRDLPGDVAPVEASRPLATEFTFKLAQPVCPGFKSRPLLLNAQLSGLILHNDVEMTLVPKAP